MRGWGLSGGLRGPATAVRAGPFFGERPGARSTMCAAYSGACVHIRATPMEAGGIPLASTHQPKETLMRAPTVLAAIALAGTVLFGGAGQALADEDDMSSAGADFGNSSPAMPDFGQGTSGAEPGGSGFGQSAPGSDQGASGSDQDESGFGQDESGFDEALGL